jgi:translation initiation factor IF-1
MNCKEYLELTPKERIEMIGSVVHLLQNDTASFYSVSVIINSGKKRSLFNNIKIMPDDIQRTENP